MKSKEEIIKEYQNVLEKLSDPELISNLDKFQEFSEKKA